MKRFHVHVAVGDLEQSTRFYSAMFGMPPSVRKPGYAKWMLEDPRLNFAISLRKDNFGLNHLGLQADTEEELAGIHANLKNADTSIVSEAGANCCYAKSDKHWVEDPSGIAWESFRTLDSIPFYGESSHKGSEGSAMTAGCCAAANDGSAAKRPACGTEGKCCG